MVSDREIGKKEFERDALFPFLDARTAVTGERLELAFDGENPDFICMQPDGTLVGVELVQVTRGPIEAHWDRVLDGKEELDPFEAQSLIIDLIARKEEARVKRYVHQVSQCILLLQLVNGTLDHIRVAFDGLEDDFADHGFSEIWVADYSAMDAYRNVQIYGLFPVDFWGFYERLNGDTKPYG